MTELCLKKDTFLIHLNLRYFLGQGLSPYVIEPLGNQGIEVLIATLTFSIL